MKKFCYFLMAIMCVVTICSCANSSDAEKTGTTSASLTATEKNEVAEEDSAVEEAKSIYSKLVSLNQHCDDMADYISVIWKGVDGEYNTLSYDISKALKTSRAYVSAATLEETLSKAEEYSLYEPGLAYLAKWIDYDWVSTGGFFTSADALTETYEILADYDSNYDKVREIRKTINEDIKSFRENYKESQAELAEELDEWYIESDMYAELVLDPSGKRIDFEQSVSDYQDAMSRYAKKVDIYIG